MQYLEMFLEYLQIEKQYSKNTITAYENDISSFINFNNGINASIDKIHEYLIFLRQSYANSTYLRKVSALKNFYKFLYKEKIITSNYFQDTEVSKKQIDIPKYLSEKDVNKFLNSLVYNTPLEARNKAMFELLYATGMRVSELINLKIEDIKLNENLVLVEGKGKKQRLIPINSTTKKYLNIYIENYYVHLNKKNSNYLFLNKNFNQITRQGFYKILKQKAFNVGFEDITPHTFRHSIATHMLNNGVNLKIIQELLGHENLVTTEIYAKVNNQTLKKEYEKYHPLNKRK